MMVFRAVGALVGALLAVAGVAMYAPAAALIAGGLALTAACMLVDDGADR